MIPDLRLTTAYPQSLLTSSVVGISDAGRLHPHKPISFNDLQRQKRL
jgi:hypothetical protein